MSSDTCQSLLAFFQCDFGILHDLLDVVNVFRVKPEWRVTFDKNTNLLTVGHDAVNRKVKPGRYLCKVTVIVITYALH
jgi:hypothetical protein